MAVLALLGCSDGGGGGPGRPLPQAGVMGDGDGGVAGASAGQAGQAGTSSVVGTGGMSGAAGGAGGATGGSGGAGGSSGAIGSDAGVCIELADAPPVNADNLPACGTCGDAHCIPAGLISVEQGEMLASCEGGEKCVPDLLIASGGMFLLETCASIGGAEGRCLSTCVPQVQAQADRLPRDVCRDSELCAPCFDPFTSLPTGACSQGCDPGPAEDPMVFGECCGGLAVCVPPSLVSEDERALLGRDDCGGELLCAPKDLAEDPNAAPEVCESLAGAEGRCLPACLPDVAVQAERLPQAACPDDYLCAPCFDPLTGENTGACTIGGDGGPTEDPVVFPGCCDDGDGMDLGTCVPSELVSSDQQSLLGADTCTGGMLCAPTPLATETYVPDPCVSVASSEGRCLPSCLPSVLAQAEQLPQADCAQGELCAPCFDPLTGADTGACTLEGDEPGDPPVVFAGCCDNGMGADLGTCVPTALVPGDQAALLGQDTCSTGDLCAPTAIAQGTYEPRTCDSWGGSEGRCLPACLPDIEAQADQLTQGSCLAGELCAPCFDPLDGNSTGSCDLEDDAPTEPPYTFATCCDDGAASDLGTCVPSALVSSEQQSLLGQDSCGAGDLCAPTPVARGEYVPDVCQSWLGAEGRCLPACLPDVAAQASSLQDPATDQCDQGELCVPCFDPLSGATTGACSLEGDVPSSTVPITFPTCCPTPSPSGADRGTCVPARAAGAQAASLPNMNCETLTNDADDYVCAPNEKVFVPNEAFPTCTTTFEGPNNCGFNFLCAIARSTARGYIEGKPGACVPGCVLSEQTTSVPLYGTFTGSELYGQSTCANGEECAPCNYPEGHAQEGVSTGLCD